MASLWSLHGYRLVRVAAAGSMYDATHATQGVTRICLGGRITGLLYCRSTYPVREPMRSAMLFCGLILGVIGCGPSTTGGGGSDAGGGADSGGNNSSAVSCDQMIQGIHV